MAESSSQETEYEAIEILKEKGGMYHIRWAGIDPETNKPWKPTWEPKAMANDLLKADWLEKKRKRKRRSSQRNSYRSESISYRSSTSSHQVINDPTTRRNSINRRSSRLSTVDNQPGTPSSSIEPRTKRRKTENVRIKTTSPKTPPARQSSSPPASLVSSKFHPTDRSSVATKENSSPLNSSQKRKQTVIPETQSDEEVDQPNSVKKAIPPKDSVKRKQTVILETQSDEEVDQPNSVKKAIPPQVPGKTSNLPPPLHTEKILLHYRMYTDEFLTIIVKRKRTVIHETQSDEGVDQPNLIKKAIPSKVSVVISKVNNSSRQSSAARSSSQARTDLHRKNEDPKRKNKDNQRRGKDLPRQDEDLARQDEGLPRQDEGLPRQDEDPSQQEQGCGQQPNSGGSQVDEEDAQAQDIPPELLFNDVSSNHTSEVEDEYSNLAMAIDPSSPVHSDLHHNQSSPKSPPTKTDKLFLLPDSFESEKSTASLINETRKSKVILAEETDENMSSPTRPTQQSKTANPQSPLSTLDKNAAAVRQNHSSLKSAGNIYDMLIPPLDSSGTQSLKTGPINETRRAKVILAEETDENLSSSTRPSQQSSAPNLLSTLAATLEPPLDSLENSKTKAAPTSKKTQTSINLAQKTDSHLSNHREPPRELYEPDSKTAELIASLNDTDDPEHLSRIVNYIKRRSIDPLDKNFLTKYVQDPLSYLADPTNEIDYLRKAHELGDHMAFELKRRKRGSINLWLKMDVPAYPKYFFRWDSSETRKQLGPMLFRYPEFARNSTDSQSDSGVSDYMLIKSSGSLNDAAVCPSSSLARPASVEKTNHSTRDDPIHSNSSESQKRSTPPEDSDMDCTLQSESFQPPENIHNDCSPAEDSVTLELDSGFIIDPELSQRLQTSDESPENVSAQQHNESAPSPIQAPIPFPPNDFPRDEIPANTTLPLEISSSSEIGPGKSLPTDGQAPPDGTEPKKSALPEGQASRDEIAPKKSALPEGQAPRDENEPSVDPPDGSIPSSNSVAGSKESSLPSQTASEDGGDDETDIVDVQGGRKKIKELKEALGALRKLFKGALEVMAIGHSKQAEFEKSKRELIQSFEKSQIDLTESFEKSRNELIESFEKSKQELNEGFEKSTRELTEDLDKSKAELTASFEIELSKERAIVADLQSRIREQDAQSTGQRMHVMNYQLEVDGLKSKIKSLEALLIEEKQPARQLYQKMTQRQNQELAQIKTELRLAQETTKRVQKQSALAEKQNDQLVDSFAKQNENLRAQLETVNARYQTQANQTKRLQLEIRDLQETDRIQKWTIAELKSGLPDDLGSTLEEAGDNSTHLDEDQPTIESIDLGSIQKETVIIESNTSATFQPVTQLERCSLDKTTNLFDQSLQTIPSDNEESSQIEGEASHAMKLTGLSEHSKTRATSHLETVSPHSSHDPRRSCPPPNGQRTTKIIRSSVQYSSSPICPPRFGTSLTTPTSAATTTRTRQLHLGLSNESPQKSGS
ncbi:hypothetical protein MJO29_007984 [Puccinia striiformis f. sp. tritici]|nr:hypothetical protein MJO29_007984 [Puccinia striiformis f. sp. tritici]